MPAIVNSPTVEITTPSGVETVPNPLLQYNFQQFPMNSNYFSPTEWDGWLASYNHTVRNPDSRGENDSDFNESNGWLKQDGNLMQGIVGLFLAVRNES
jgi:tyrosinase